MVFLILPPLVGPTILFLVVYIAFKHVTRPKPIPDVPSLPAISFFGNGLDIAKHYKKTETIHDAFIDVLRKTGGMVLGQVLISAFTPILLTADPDQIDRILISQDWDRGIRSTGVFKPLIPHALLALSIDEEYKAHKRAFAFGVSSSFLKETSKRFIEEDHALIDTWSSQTGEWFDPEPELTYRQARAISAVVFGEPSNLIDKDLKTLFKTLSAGPLAPIKRMIEKVRPTNREAYKRIIQYVQSRTTISRKKFSEGGDVALIENMIDGIVQKEAESGVAVLSPDGLRDELVSMILAGDETSVTTQLWVLKFLSNHPAIQYKLRQHLLERVEPLDVRSPTVDDLTPEHTPFLEAVIQEVLRVGNPVAIIGREAMRDTTLVGPSGGKSFPAPKGTKILLLLGPEGTEGRVGKDTMEFKPERWLNEKGEYDSSAVWQASFAKGPRACYGSKQALISIRMFIVYISLTFFLEKPPPKLQSTRRVERVTLRPSDLVIKLKPWEKLEQGEN
uniref:Cyp5491A1 n=1 Tax=Phaffia rhodozyma TaxID=264483 RepID=A0A221SAF7_PHARH|nr:Cyp5491A1 [Phaffia rhodozyma]